MLLIAFILFIWFESDILFTLAKLFRLHDKLSIKDYEKQRLEFEGKFSFIDFIYMKKTNMFTKLLSCPICMCFWLTLLYSFIIYNNIIFASYMFAFHYFLNLSIYLLVKKLYDHQ